MATYPYVEHMVTHEELASMFIEIMQIPSKSAHRELAIMFKIPRRAGYKIHFNTSKDYLSIDVLIH